MTTIGEFRAEAAGVSATKCVQSDNQA